MVLLLEQAILIIKIGKPKEQQVFGLYTVYMIILNSICEEMREISDKQSRLLRFLHLSICVHLLIVQQWK